MEWFREMQKFPILLSKETFAKMITALQNAGKTNEVIKDIPVSFCDFDRLQLWKSSWRALMFRLLLGIQ